jgi:hypothetical protein
MRSHAGTHPIPGGPACVDADLLGEGSEKKKKKNLLNSSEQDESLIGSNAVKIRGRFISYPPNNCSGVSTVL